MRKTFVGSLCELARRDERIVLLTADLGYSVLEPFAEEFPGRFFNVGVAEQNMLGLATGMAGEGLIPFVYSMGTFAVLRPYEFIRNGPILHRSAVRIVGVGAGYDYGTAGSTHHSLEDIAVLRAQPGIEIYSPSDSAQLRNILQKTWDRTGPIYYRLSKDERPDIPGMGGAFETGRAQQIGEGRDVLLITTGSIALDVSAAAKRLKETHAIHASLLIIASIQPAPKDDLLRLLTQFSHAATVEAHSVNGGLGSLVAEFIAEGGLSCRISRLGVRGASDGILGDAAYLNAKQGLSEDGIVKSILHLLGKTAA